MPATHPDLSQISFDNLRLKLATTPQELEAAQHCRFEVFYKELGAKPLANMAETERDFDDFDAFCDHLLVLDTTQTGMAQVVGTYRMLRHSVATQAGIGLYTETEFDLSKLKAKAATENANILEFSRSCVLPNYRGRMVINLLWKGLAACVLHYGVKYLIGTPSFHGTDISALMPQLSYLQANHAVANDICPQALPEQQQVIPPFTGDAANIKDIISNLPPLIKGYLRTGARFGHDAVIDQQFNTVDMCMVLDFAEVSEKHLQYYTREG